MKVFSFFTIGTLFGFVLTKAEVISYYRIFEMFRFDSFHMYGIIMTAIGILTIFFQVVKKFKIKNFYGGEIGNTDIKWNPKRHLLSGTIFGLGWALAGACPGPIFTLIGHGFSFFLVILLGSLLGTFAYGAWGSKNLPH